MKLTEITAQSSKDIKRLQRLYVSYMLKPQTYSALYESLIAASNSNDPDLEREVSIIKEKLKSELIEVLKK